MSSARCTERDANTGRYRSDAVWSRKQHFLPDRGVFLQSGCLSGAGVHAKACGRSHTAQASSFVSRSRRSSCQDNSLQHLAHSERAHGTSTGCIDCQRPTCDQQSMKASMRVTWFSTQASAASFGMRWHLQPAPSARMKKSTSPTCASPTCADKTLNIDELQDSTRRVLDIIVHVSTFCNIVSPSCSRHGRQGILTSRESRATRRTRPWTVLCLQTHCTCHALNHRFAQDSIPFRHESHRAPSPSHNRAPSSTVRFSMLTRFDEPLYDQIHGHRDPDVGFSVHVDVVSDAYSREPAARGLL